MIVHNVLSAVLTNPAALDLRNDNSKLKDR
jgi:hypothetical protein